MLRILRERKKPSNKKWVHLVIFANKLWYNGYRVSPLISSSAEQR